MYKRNVRVGNTQRRVQHHLQRLGTNTVIEIDNSTTITTNTDSGGRSQKHPTPPQSQRHAAKNKQ